MLTETLSGNDYGRPRDSRSVFRNIVTGKLREMQMYVKGNERSRLILSYANGVFNARGTGQPIGINTDGRFSHSYIINELPRNFSHCYDFLRLLEMGRKADRNPDFKLKLGRFVSDVENELDGILLDLDMPTLRSRDVRIITGRNIRTHDIFDYNRNEDTVKYAYRVIDNTFVILS